MCSVNQLVEIIKVMGTPTHAEIDLMNPKYKRARCPEVPSVPFTEVRLPSFRSNHQH